MDILSKLFSASNKKCNSTFNEQNVEVRPRTDSAANDQFHEAGVFCRASRVDQIESSNSSNIAVHLDNENLDNGTSNSERLAASSNAITKTLDRWNPETCVRLLHMPSVQNYSGLCRLISGSDQNWMIEFLGMGGLKVLFDSVDRLSKRSQNSPRIERTLLLLQCVSCLKAVTKSHFALEHIIQQRTYTKVIVEVLCCRNPLVKKQLFDFMSELCVFSEDGHYLTLDALETYRVMFKLRYRFDVLIIEIKQAEVMAYVASVLGLINCIILGACDFRFRTRIRNEFLAVGLQDLLESLKNIPEEEVQVHCSVFIKSQLADEEYAISTGIRPSFSHFALFQSLLDKIENTPLAASFLILLQNLNQFDPTDTKTDYVWSILEEITERALIGAESVLRNWMLSECRRSNLKSIATQTSFFVPRTLSIEESVTYLKESTCDEDCEKDSVKSYSSRDSGIPVSRNQSFASRGVRLPQNTYSSIDNTFSETVTNRCDTELPNAVKDGSDSELSVNSKDDSDTEQGNQLKPRHSSSFFKTVGLSFTFLNSTNNKTQPKSCTEKPNTTLPEATQLSLRSDFPIPQNDVLMEEKCKTKKPFSFPFFSRSKKYTLPKCSPTLTSHLSPPDMQQDSTVSPATLRNGMISVDVKRSRKHLSNNILQNNDNSSLTSGDKDISFSSEITSTSESCENKKENQCAPILRSFSTTEHGETLNSTGFLSKSTSDLNQIIPPPPPPPPPPNFNAPPANRQRYQNFLPSSSSKIIRSSWSGNPTIKECEESGKRLYNTLPKPKSKMKTLNWAKIPTALVNAHSIWSEIDQEANGMEVNFEEMEKLFCQVEPKPKEPRAQHRQRVISGISLLDSKRSLSIGIFLKQFKGESEEVVEYLRQCKHKEIGAERLRTLLNLLPDSNEIKLLNSYKGDIKQLGSAEKFILTLKSIDHYECCVEGMLLLEEFPNTIQILHDSVQSLLDACKELLTNMGFKNFLKLVLVTGNYMNSGSYAGNAVGFRLSTLLKLMETRANRPRITLLHYLADAIQKRDKDGLNFTNELMEKLKRCSRLTLESLSSEIMQLEKSIVKLKSNTEIENGKLKKKFSGFIENGMKHLAVLKKKMSDISYIATQLANRFCEDEKKFQLEECLNIVSVFCSKLKVADSENKAQKIAEEKKLSKSGSKIDLKFCSSKVATL